MSPKLTYKDGYDYQVRGDYTIQTNMVGFDIDTRWFRLTPDGLLTIRDGYAWDGASGAFDKGLEIPSLVHDAFYQMLREGLLPHDPCFHIANKELSRIYLEDAIEKAEIESKKKPLGTQWAFKLAETRWAKTRAEYVFIAVESFGDAHAAVRTEKLLTAP